jgi:hypothetical protein
MTNCVPWALSAITGMPVRLIEAVLSPQPGGIPPGRALKVLRSLGYNEAQIHIPRAPTTVREWCEEHSNEVFYLSTGGHAMVCTGAQIYDNYFPSGIPGNHHPSTATALQCIIDLKGAIP